MIAQLRYDVKAVSVKNSENISNGRVADIDFDRHLFRLVLLFRVKQVQVTNAHIKQLGRKILSFPKYKTSKAQALKFSNCWVNKFKRRYHLAYRRSAKTHITKAKAEDIDVWQADIQALVEDNNIPIFLIGTTCSSSCIHIVSIV